MELNQFGKILKERRLENGWGSATAARHLSISPTYYSRLENGRVKPSPSILALIARVYKLPVEDQRLVEQLAGYGTDAPTDSKNTEKEGNKSASLKVTLNPEKHQILFSDVMFVSSSDNGMVFDFGQKGSAIEANIVTRVGVAYEHAVKIHKVLGQHIKKVEDRKHPQKN